MKRRPRVDRVRWSGVGLAAALNMAGAVAVLWDGLRHRGTHLVGAADTETWTFAWGAWWMGASLLGEGRLPYETTLLDHPVGGVLWLKDPLLCLLTLPLQVVAGVPAATLAGLFFVITMGGLGAFLLARELGVDRLVAAAASLTFALCPHILGEAYNGNTEAMNGAVCAWWAYALVRVVRVPSAGRVAVAVVTLVALLVTNQYYGLAMAMVSGPLALLAAREAGRPRGLVGLAVAVGLGLALFAPFAWALFESLSHPRQLTLIDRSVPLEPPYISDLRHLWAPLADLRGPLSTPSPFQDLVYPGLLLALLGLAAPVLNRGGVWRWFAPAAALGFGILSLGPILVIDGTPVRMAGRVVELPWSWLIRDKPILGSMSLPHRMAVPAGLFWTLAAAVGLQGLVDRFAARGRAVGVALLGLALAEGLTLPGYQIPLQTIPLDRPYAVALAGALPVEGALLDLPVIQGQNKLRRYLWYQTIHGRPVAFSIRHGTVPPVGGAVPWVAELVQMQRGALSQPEEPAEVAAALRDQGFAVVVLHGWVVDPHRGASREAWIQAVDAALGPGLELSDGSVIWTTDARGRGLLVDAAQEHLPAAALDPYLNDLTLPPGDDSAVVRDPHMAPGR